MKKLLIYEDKNKILPTGGPEGYLYNLMIGLKEYNQNDFEIEFLEETPNKTKQKLKEFYMKLPKKIKGKLKCLNAEKFYKSMKNDELINNKIDFSQYDYIHFHYTFDLYKNKSKLKDYKGKIILTSHSPEPYHLEYIDKIYDLVNDKSVYKKFAAFEEFDRYAFERADYVFFPCEEAEEPYSKNWDFFDKFKREHKDKFRYILSGVEKKQVTVSPEEIREKYKIPSSAFVISYVGRHNEVKGYGDLKLIGQKILKENDDIYFICAGKEGPMYKLENERWIEVGWTNDPASIINASNLFILPNKETYFDLVFLEVLSIGVPILASDCGGNRYFNKYKTNGIVLFKSIEDACNKILKLKPDLTDKDKIQEIKRELKGIYEKDFSSQIFAKNYIELLKSI